MNEAESSEYYDEEDSEGEEQPEDGIPWYHVYNEVDALEGIKFELKNQNELSAAVATM